MLMNIKFIPETESYEIVINGIVETIPVEEFYKATPTKLGRAQYLLKKMNDNRTQRITRAFDFIRFIEENTKHMSDIIVKMEKDISDGDMKNLDAYKMVITALSNQKQSFKEIRYAIKLLEAEEGKIKSEILELSIK